MTGPRDTSVERRGRALRGAAIAVGLALGACASTPKGFLTPTGIATPGATLVDMLVATTRNPSPEPGVIFGGERDPGYSIARIVVSIPPAANRRVGQIQWPRDDTPDARREFTTVSVEPSDQAASRAWFRRVAGRQGRLLVFVHGYNTRFESAVYRLAQIAEDSGAHAAPVLFTWPSRGRMFDYEYDRDSANFSRDPLENLLTRAVEVPEVKEVTVLAHSMGTYLAMEALRQMAIRRGRLPDKIGNIVLAAPDIDPQVFARQFQELGSPRPRVTIFVTRDDRALRISRFISGKVGRLGAIDPSKEPYRSHLEANPEITVIDLSAYKSGDALNHGKFAESPEVVQMIGQRLVNDQQMTGAP